MKKKKTNKQGYKKEKHKIKISLVRFMIEARQGGGMNIQNTEKKLGRSIVKCGISKISKELYGSRREGVVNFSESFSVLATPK